MDDVDGLQMDPSSISLFSSSSATQANAKAEERQTDSNSQTFSMEDVQEQSKPSQESMSYSKYAQKRTANATNRRNLVERIEKLKNKGLHFTIPQFAQATACQISQFFRKFRRSNETKSLISADMIERIFADEKKPKAEIFSKGNRTIEVDQSMFRVLAMNELKEFTEEEKRLYRRGRIGQTTLSQSEDETTEEETMEYDDDDLFGSKNNISAELYNLLEQRTQILTVEKHAKRMQEEIDRKIIEADTIVGYSIRPTFRKHLFCNTQNEFLFEMPDKSDSDELDSMTCARCRPTLLKDLRELAIGNIRQNHGRPLRPIIANKRCGTEEYAFTDQSVHPMLSMPSSISLDVQLQKYLHVISFIPLEIEMRRHRTSQIVAIATGKDMRRKFYNLAEENHEEISDCRLDSHESMKLSLPFRKVIKREHKVAIDDSEADSDPSDCEFIRSPTLAKKRRRMTIDHHPVKKFNSSKPSKLEGRRMSHVEYGASMFDYDPHLMDIGLALPAIQKVENVEIAIPSFRRKPALLNLPASVECQKCQSRSDPWAGIQRFHGDLEAQERQQRIRPKVGSLARKMTTISELSTNQSQEPDEPSNSGKMKC